MACLCAPTSHEGSFRCRLHRGMPLVINSAPFAANHISKGGSREISDHLWLVTTSSCKSPSTAHSAPHQAPIPCNLRKSPSPSLPSARPAPPSSSSSLLPVRSPRPPPSKRAISSSSRSPCPESSTSSETSATRCMPTAPNASRVAALAIMKQHLHNKHIKSNGDRNINTLRRSSAAYSIGPSRLSRMARAACTDEIPALKSADCCCTPNPPPQSTLWLKPSSSFNSDGPQARGLTSMEANPFMLKMHTVLPKFKQSESSCKVVGYKAGPLIVSTVY